MMPLLNPNTKFENMKLKDILLLSTLFMQNNT